MKVKHFLRNWVLHYAKPEYFYLPGPKQGLLLIPRQSFKYIEVENKKYIIPNFSPKVDNTITYTIYDNNKNIINTYTGTTQVDLEPGQYWYTMKAIGVNEKFFFSMFIAGYESSKYIDGTRGVDGLELNIDTQVVEWYWGQNDKPENHYYLQSIKRPGNTTEVEQLKHLSFNIKNIDLYFFCTAHWTYYFNIFYKGERKTSEFPIEPGYMWFTNSHSSGTSADPLGVGTDDLGYDCVLGVWSYKSFTKPSYINIGDNKLEMLGRNISFPGSIVETIHKYYPSYYYTPAKVLLQGLGAYPDPFCLQSATYDVFYEIDGEKQIIGSVESAFDTKNTQQYDSKHGAFYMNTIGDYNWYIQTSSLAPYHEALNQISQYDIEKYSKLFIGIPDWHCSAITYNADGTKAAQRDIDLDYRVQTITNTNFGNRNQYYNIMTQLYQYLSGLNSECINVAHITETCLYTYWNNGEVYTKELTCSQNILYDGNTELYKEQRYVNNNTSITEYFEQLSINPNFIRYIITDITIYVFDQDNI